MPRKQIHKEIRAERIVLVDANGKERIIMETDEQKACLKITDTNRKNRIEIYDDGKDSWIIVRNSTGKMRFAVGTDDHEASLCLYDMAGRSRLDLVADHEEAWLLMRDAKEKNRLAINCNEDNTEITLKNARERKRIQISAGSGENDQGGSVKIHNNKNRKIVHLRADKYGKGVMGAYKRNGVGNEIKP